ncbi:hypothetical protein M422DRAFT_783177 [Sphaerobolus stellatus SS14]|uniref:Alpha/beta hydrolase fold-3 domain-containing protein n=1 Tax=Sphaerobolus stellatus (strain SS14) TaxID=990650 RepID=A0A0C9V802_SPHS4|nr:hypothetical protein M422DRAFT_783177 [Sphaerobolus stellatus SS14]
MTTTTVSPIMEKKLTALQTAGVFLNVARALLTGLFAAFTYPLTPSSVKQNGLVKEINRRITKKLAGISDPLQAQAVMPSGTKVYNDWMASEAAKRGLPTEPVTELFEDGGKLHWIGRKNAKKLILHFHSGGFALPFHAGHINIVDYFRQEIFRRSQIDVKMAFLQYTLLPHATYPTQFHQAITVINHILSSGISPSDIVLTGDSAGGMLAIEIISHILHSHPSMPPVGISTPFAGILLISPWVNLDIGGPSFTENSAKDIIDEDSLTGWSDMVREGTRQGGRTPESERNWLEAAKAPPEWWNGTAKVAKNVFLLYGEREVLKDGLVTFADNFKKGVKEEGVNVQVVEEKDGIHIATVVDAMRGFGINEITKVMAGWVHERITAS